MKMDMKLKTRFEELFAKYLPGVELPIAFYFADTPPPSIKAAPPAKGWRCFISDLASVRRGDSLALDEAGLGCGKRFCGFPTPMRPDFNYFLSYGIPGKMEGERYKKTPEIVEKLNKNLPSWKAPARYLLLKRWDKLTADDFPEAVCFFAAPDVLAALFTLANYEESDPFGVIAPFSAGCGTVIQYPYLENQKENPRCVLGMFDVSARPHVNPGELTFAAPMKRLLRMVGNMEESFLITASWEKIKKRL